LAVGAKAVMIGRLFAGCPEAPGSHHVIDNVRVKRYRGMASEEALAEAGKERNLEGVPAWIPVTASVKNVIEDLKIGMRAGFAYMGARGIQELQERCEYVTLTYQGFAESKPRV
jgi:IMP dehydrogenase